MAIFSRRTLQRVIDENAKFLKSKQSIKFVEKLNEGKLEFEWEAVVLNVFSKFGNVIHEPPFEKSRRKIDILFTSKDESSKFLADVTCILGKKDENNIIVSFEKELKKIIDQNNLSGLWDIFVGGNDREVSFLKSKPNLKLPSRNESERKIFNTEKFKKFIEDVKNFPGKNQDYYLRNKEINLSIKYEPRPFYQIHISHYDDRTITSISQNNIYDRLKDKYDQLIELIETDKEEALGIILCDGFGCSFRTKNALYHNPKDVIKYFLLNHKEISFILTATAEEKPHNLFDRTPLIMIDFYEGEAINKIDEKTTKILKYELINQFPKPVKSVWDARNFVKETHKNNEKYFSEGYYGSIFSDNEIRISARTMLELLSGKLSCEKLSHYLGFEGLTNSIPNQFLEMLNQGKLFSELKIENGKDEKDDDWIVFKFGETDPAVSPFKVSNPTK